jgi:S1-C subfamily serine protease
LEKPTKKETETIATSRADRAKQRLRGLIARVRRLAPYSVGMLIAFAAILLYNVILPGPRPMTTQDVKDTLAQAMASATPPPPFATHVFQAVQPSLVQIDTDILSQNGKVQGALGSGVIIDDSGSILTALHVVAQAIDIQVTFADGVQAPGNVIASQPESDIAVLRAGPLPPGIGPAVLGDPSVLHVGDDAFVVGNPFGIYGSLTTGTISGLNRSFQPSGHSQKLKGLIQFDAAVNPGNSGGPLLNRDGEVVGIVSGLVNPTGQDVFIGIGFAVPIDVAASAAGSPPY